MAASAQSPEFAPSGWVDNQESTGISVDTSMGKTKGLGFGMSTMSLMPSPGVGPDASSIPDMSSTLDDSGSNREQRKIADSGDSVHSHRSLTNSPLPPSGSSKGMGSSRPPGLGLPASAVIGKPDHLTLTPTSSLDGGSDMYNMGRQSSPFHGDGPSMSSDYSGAGGRGDGSEYPPGLGNLGVGSFDDDGGHDGLLGLQALGGQSKQQPARGQTLGSIIDDQHRPRAVSRDSGRPPSTSRPPLSGSGALNADATNYVHGAISRPPDSRYAQYGGETIDQGLSRRRSISTDTGREFNHAPYSGNPAAHAARHNSMDHLSQKFSNLSALGPQSDQQRMQSQQQYQSAQQSRPPTFQSHQRSMSQPGPMGGQGALDYQHEDQPHNRGGNEYGVGFGTQQRYSPSTEGDYMPPDRYGSSHQYQQRRDGGNLSQGRSMSLSHGSNMMQNSFDVTPIRSQRRSSLQAIPGEFDGPPLHVQRRASLQNPNSNSLYGQQTRYTSDSGPILASSEEMRMFSGSEGERMGYPRHERMVTPAHSPLHTNYGGHSRHPSDMGSSTMSSSPMSLGSGGVRGMQRGGQHRGSHSDEEFSHGLAGEHIDMSGDDNPYMMHEGMHPHSQMRSGHGHGVMDNPYAMEAHHHLPTAGAALPMPKAMYNVKFKRTQRSFAIGPRLNRDLKVGTYVKVEADRGEDLGIVVGKLPPEKYNLAGKSPYRGEMGMVPPGGMGPTGVTDPKRIIRLATHDEVSLLGIKREEEEELLKVCRTKCRQRGLPMHVVDAEYQFDRHKLTFFFEAEGRIDFRELVRDLFSIYKTRIWMQQLDKTTAATCPTAPQTPQPLVMDYGTPIIAPESEFIDFAALNASGGEAATEND